VVSATRTSTFRRISLIQKDPELRRIADPAEDLDEGGSGPQMPLLA
jgi:hypothetical protein